MASKVVAQLGGSRRRNLQDSPGGEGGARWCILFSLGIYCSLLEIVTINPMCDILKGGVDCGKIAIVNERNRQTEI
jgi:hypothetical protein